MTRKNVKLVCQIVRLYAMSLNDADWIAKRTEIKELLDFATARMDKYSTEELGARVGNLYDTLAQAKRARAQKLCDEKNLVIK